MGYLSEVAITVPNEAFKELIEKAKAENSEAYEFIKNGSVYQTDKYTTMHFDWVKWYDGYPEVQFVEAFIRDVPYVFKRVGEDYDDTECHEGDIEDYDIYTCVHIVRCLDVESAGELITIEGIGEDGNGYRQQAI